VLILVWRYTSSPVLSFMAGMDIISGRLASGCANLTILYLIPFLLILYVVFIFITFIGLFKGRVYVQNAWIRFISRFVERRPADNEINDV
jgi:hypothetical protein